MGVICQDSSQETLQASEFLGTTAPPAYTATPLRARGSYDPFASPVAPLGDVDKDDSGSTYDPTADGGDADEGDADEGDAEEGDAEEDDEVMLVEQERHAKRREVMILMLTEEAITSDVLLKAIGNRKGDSVNTTPSPAYRFLNATDRDAIISKYTYFPSYQRQGTRIGNTWLIGLDGNLRTSKFSPISLAGEVRTNQYLCRLGTGYSSKHQIP